LQKGSSGPSIRQIQMVRATESQLLPNSLTHLLSAGFEADLPRIARLRPRLGGWPPQPGETRACPHCLFAAVRAPNSWRNRFTHPSLRSFEAAPFCPSAVNAMRQNEARMQQPCDRVQPGVQLHCGGFAVPISEWLRTLTVRAGRRARASTHITISARAHAEYSVCNALPRSTRTLARRGAGVLVLRHGG
jgi:hypothetical protein